MADLIHIENLIGHGQLHKAYDLALEKTQQEPENSRAKYLLVLCLLRAGALQEAERLYETFELASIANADEDIQALKGRLQKGLMYGAPPHAKKAIAKQAAEYYRAAWTATGGYYSGINTATLFYLAGETDSAIEIAKQLRQDLAAKDTSTLDSPYYHYATLAEAALLLGDVDAARKYLKSSIRVDPKNLGARSSTIKQLQQILNLSINEIDWLDDFRPGVILHYAGHIFNEGDPQFETLTASINAQIADTDSEMAYGSLAAGSDLVIAEALLNADIPLHVVLPVPPEQFVEGSVKPYGQTWVAKFNACIKAAQSLRIAHDASGSFDDTVTSYASEIAMGLAQMKARELATVAEQWIVYNSMPPSGEAGTAIDAQAWQKTGHAQIRIPIKRQGSTSTLRDTQATCPRMLKAMLFADIKGYGKLPDRKMPEFVEHVLGRLASGVETLDVPPTHSDTWGDGLFLAFDSVRDASEAALLLQKQFRSIDMEAYGLPSDLALRVGAHYGPVHEIDDPFAKTSKLFGRQVTLAARIEPLTLPGAIHVSEAFAAALSLENARRTRCEYLGRFDLSTSITDIPIFSLRSQFN